MPNFEIDDNINNWAQPKEEDDWERRWRAFKQQQADDREARENQSAPPQSTPPTLPDVNQPFLPGSGVQVAPAYNVWNNVPYEQSAWYKWGWGTPPPASGFPNGTYGGTPLYGDNEPDTGYRGRGGKPPTNYRGQGTYQPTNPKGTDFNPSPDNTQPTDKPKTHQRNDDNLPVPPEQGSTPSDKAARQTQQLANLAEEYKRTHPNATYNEAYNAARSVLGLPTVSDKEVGVGATGSRDGFSPDGRMNPDSRVPYSNPGFDTKMPYIKPGAPWSPQDFAGGKDWLANPYQYGSQEWNARQIEVDRRKREGNGGGGRGNAGFATNPSTSPTSPVNPTNQNPWSPQVYQNSQGVLKFDDRDLGIVSDKARPYVDAILRENGWIPSGQYGTLGATEYKYSKGANPTNIWFDPNVFKNLPGDIAAEIQKLFAAKGWSVAPAS